VSQLFITVTHHQFCHYTRLQMKGRPWHCIASFNIHAQTQAQWRQFFPFMNFTSKGLIFFHGSHNSSAVLHWHNRHDDWFRKTTPKCFIVSTLSKINLIFAKK
jgi:hypothetical protein